jgi:hypothetical protein
VFGTGWCCPKAYFRYSDRFMGLRVAGCEKGDGFGVPFREAILLIRTNALIK